MFLLLHLLALVSCPLDVGLCLTQHTPWPPSHLPCPSPALLPKDSSSPTSHPTCSHSVSELSLLTMCFLNVHLKRFYCFTDFSFSAVSVEWLAAVAGFFLHSHTLTFKPLLLFLYLSILCILFGCLFPFLRSTFFTCVYTVFE